MTVVALGSMPYISASMILPVLTVVFPQLEKPQNEGALEPTSRRIAATNKI